MPLKIAGIVKKNDLAAEKAEEFLKSAYNTANEAIKKRNETLEKFKKALNLPK